MAPQSTVEISVIGNTSDSLPNLVTTTAGSAGVYTSMATDMSTSNPVAESSSAATSELPPPELIFLQTPFGRGLAGLFAWAAFFITCHQVGTYFFFSFQILVGTVTLVYFFLVST